MLYKDGELYKLTDKDRDIVYKRFPFIVKKGVRLVYPETRVKENPLPHNRLPDKPNSISFPLRATYKDERVGTEIWRYAEDVVHLDGGDKKYYPINFTYNGMKALTKNDIELIWFLYTKCPYLQDGLNANNKKPKIMFENKPEQANKQAQKEAEMADVKALLYSEKLGLDDETLKMAARAYFISDVDDYTINEVKIHLQTAIFRDKVNGPKRFLELVQGGKEIDTRSKIQEAIDKKLIRYNMARREWDWIDDQEKKVEQIMRVPKAKNYNVAICTLFNSDKNFQEELEEALVSGNYVKEHV